MKPEQLVCDANRIELFFNDQLGQQEQLEFEAHLSECTHCREKLQASTASDEFQADLRASLLNWEQPVAESGFETTAGEATRFYCGRIVDLLAPSDDDRMLGRLGSYEIVGVVGSGGMGVVLKAFDAPLNRYVAIKLLAPHLAGSAAARKRFSREAQAAAAVVHENVIEIHNVSQAAGLPYLVMPYVRGPSLQKRLDVDGPLQVVEVLRIAVQAAAGLSAAHAQGLVHRDVKPANIMLADNVERLKLTDFGLARAADDATLTKTGVIAGTPQYMSPEQARGETVDHRSDLFSLGSVLYTLCTGRPPFRAETSYGVLRRITDHEPQAIQEINADIPEWLCDIIAKLMAKSRGDRFQSASEAAELLEACLAHVQQPANVPLPQSLTPKTTTGRWFSLPSFGVIAVIAFLLIGSLGILGWQSTGPHDIGGNWRGEGWGDVTLKRTSAGNYEGGYTDTFGKEKGKIVLSWSRLENRYKGTWSEGKDRRGKISLRRYENEIRGAWTTSKRSKIQPGVPELAELTWKQAEQSRNLTKPPARGIAPASSIAKQEERIEQARRRLLNIELTFATIQKNSAERASNFDEERARLEVAVARQQLRIEQALLANMKLAQGRIDDFDLSSSPQQPAGTGNSLPLVITQRKIAQLELALFKAQQEHERALNDYGPDNNEAIRTAAVVQRLKAELAAAARSFQPREPQLPAKNRGVELPPARPVETPKEFIDPGLGSESRNNDPRNTLANLVLAFRGEELPGTKFHHQWNEIFGRIHSFETARELQFAQVEITEDSAIAISSPLNETHGRKLVVQVRLVKSEDSIWRPASINIVTNTDAEQALIDMKRNNRSSSFQSSSKDVLRLANSVVLLMQGKTNNKLSGLHRTLNRESVDALKLIHTAAEHGSIRTRYILDSGQNALIVTYPFQMAPHVQLTATIQIDRSKGGSWRVASIVAATEKQAALQHVEFLKKFPQARQHELEVSSELLQELTDAAMALVRGRENDQLQQLKKTLDRESLGALDSIHQSPKHDFIALKYFCRSDKGSALAVTKPFPPSAMDTVAAVEMEQQSNGDWKITSLTTRPVKQTSDLITGFYGEFPDARQITITTDTETLEPAPPLRYAIESMMRVLRKEVDFATIQVDADFSSVKNALTEIQSSIDYKDLRPVNIETSQRHTRVTTNAITSKRGTQMNVELLFSKNQRGQWRPGAFRTMPVPHITPPHKTPQRK